jgi:hypothetical protein
VRREDLDQGPDLMERRLGPGADGTQLTGAHAFGVAGDRGGDHGRAKFGKSGANGFSLIHADTGAVDHNARHSPGSHPAVAEQYLLEVLAG